MSEYSYAPDLDDDQRELLQNTEQSGIEAIAAQNGRITDIQNAQRDALRDELGREDARLEEEVEKQGNVREERFHYGVRVADLPGNVAGMEHDDTRKIEVDVSMASVLETSQAQADEVDKHEWRHKLQKKNNDVENVPLTGNQGVDELLEIEHTAYREEDAMYAAGHRFTAQAYITDYQQPVNRVRSYLNAGGESGESFVREAGLNGKMREVREAIWRVYTQKEDADVLRN